MSKFLIWKLPTKKTCPELVEGVKFAWSFLKVELLTKAMLKTIHSTKISSDPSTDEEWTIHAINIHGLFFERWCQEIISKSNTWRVKYVNYPVEFPPSGGFQRGKEGNLDIWATYETDDIVITLIIECKKNNPDLSSWVFFYKQSGIRGYPNFTRIINKPSEDKKWKSLASYSGYLKEYLVANEARETKSFYQNTKQGDKTKTSNTAITEAANQITLATHSIIYEENKLITSLEKKDPPVKMPYKMQVFIPMIVTTARMKFCRFDAKDVDPKTGEIPFNRAELSECPSLLYEYPIPKLLQHKPENPDTWEGMMLKNKMDIFVRKDILIVQSEAFTEVLRDLKGLKEWKEIT